MTAPAYDDSNVFGNPARRTAVAQALRGRFLVAYHGRDATADGHSLVIPKAPSRNLLDADPETLTRLILTVQKLAKAVKSAFRADGVAVYQFNEAASGQSVFHLHFHIVPRFDGVAVKPHGEDGGSGDACGECGKDQGRAEEMTAAAACRGVR